MVVVSELPDDAEGRGREKGSRGRTTPPMVTIAGKLGAAGANRLGIDRVHRLTLPQPAASPSSTGLLEEHRP